MNFSQFQQQLQQTVAFTEQLANQFPDGNIPALDKDVLAARLRHLYELLTFSQTTTHFTQVAQAAAMVETPVLEVEQPAAVVENPVVEVTQPAIVVENPVLEVTQPAIVVETPVLEVTQPAIVVETPVLEVEQPAAVVETPVVEVTQPVSNEVEFVVEQPETRVKPEIIEKPTLEIVNTEPVQDNTLTVINTPKEEPKNEATGLVINSGFSMVEQKNNAVTINNRAIYDANEEALRNQSAFKSEYDELFEFKAASELSQRLSETKVEDLNKAMGLNEKFFYINELFGGNSTKFRACLEFLNNNAKSIESAREYLEADIMDTHNWANPKRKPLAKDFIKTVRRRYLK